MSYTTNMNNVEALWYDTGTSSPRDHATPPRTVRKKKSSYDLRDEFHHGDTSPRKLCDGDEELGDTRVQPLLIRIQKVVRRHSD